MTQQYTTTNFNNDVKTKGNKGEQKFKELLKKNNIPFQDIADEHHKYDLIIKTKDIKDNNSEIWKILKKYVKKNQKELKIDVKNNLLLNDKGTKKYAMIETINNGMLFWTPKKLEDYNNNRQYTNMKILTWEDFIKELDNTNKIKWWYDWFIIYLEDNSDKTSFYNIKNILYSISKFYNKNISEEKRKEIEKNINNNDKKIYDKIKDLIKNNKDFLLYFVSSFWWGVDIKEKEHADLYVFTTKDLKDNNFWFLLHEEVQIVSDNNKKWLDKKNNTMKHKLNKISEKWSWIWQSAFFSVEADNVYKL